MTYPDGKKIDWLPFLIIIFIGFQQFPVIRVGGSLRIYEILAFFGVFFALKKASEGRVRLNWLFFIFFVASPFISLWYFWLSDPPFNSYVAAFPDKWQDFRYMPFPATFVPAFYYGLCFVSYFLIVNSKWIYRNKEKVIYWCICVGFFIAILSLFTSVLNFFSIPGIIQVLPDSVQNVGVIEYAGRGFCLIQETSLYVLYKGWIVLFSIYYKNLLSAKFRHFVIFVQLVALFSTMSSALVAFFASLVLMNLLISNFSFRKLLKYVLFLFLFLLIVYYSGFWDYFYYMGIEKVMNFFSNPDSTGDSGFMRAYTAKLGLMIFLDHPFFGVGPGASIYYMPHYSNLYPISFVSEYLNAGSVPQNSYVSVLAELGIFGFIFMISVLLYCLRQFYKLRHDPRDKLFLIGLFFTVGSLLSVTPAYSMFIWVFLFLGVNFSCAEQRFVS
ncbi:MAG: O-antigen ligase family protein [Porticoccaceae bacterium]